MWDFSFLAVPNIEGMRLWWYIQIFGIGIFFGICLFFVIYFRLIYRRKKALVYQLNNFDQQAQNLWKQLLQQKIQISTGKTKLTLFIEYLERFVTNKPYANVWELLLPQWFISKEVEECEQIIYADKELSKHIEHKIHNYFTS